MTEYRIRYKSYDSVLGYNYYWVKAASKEEALKLFGKGHFLEEVISVDPIKEYRVFYVTTAYHSATIKGASEFEVKDAIMSDSPVYWRDELIQSHNEVKSIEEVKEEKE